MTVARDLAGGPARRVRASAGPGLARSPASLPVSLGHGRVSGCTQIGVIGVAGVPPCRPPGPAPRSRMRGEADIELILAPPSMWRLPAALITGTKAAGAGGSDCTPRRV